MAVYTQLSQQDIEQFLQAYFNAELLSQEAISAGTDNSNFKLTVQSNKELKYYILTVFENMDTQAVQQSLQLLQILQAHGMPVAAAVKDKYNNLCGNLANKPASLVPFFNGHHPEPANPQQCYALGEALGHLHNIPLDKLNVTNTGTSVFSQVAPYIKQLTAAEYLNEPQFHLLNNVQQRIEAELGAMNALPRRLIHSDLFKDNVLFDGNRLSSILDFYDAHIHVALYDLAVAVNDWCFMLPAGSSTQSSAGCKFIDANYRALIQGYTDKRPLNSQEQHLWHTMLQLAALRFWLSRLCLMLKLEKQGKAPHQDKPPSAYFNILQWLGENQLAL